MTASVLLFDPEGLVSGAIEAALAQAFRTERRRDLAGVDVRSFDALVVPETLVRELPAALSDDARLIVVGAQPSLHGVVAAIRAQARDFVTDEPDTVVRAVEGVLAAVDLEARLSRLRLGIPVPASLPELLGESDAMERLRQRILRIAASSATTLISGPSGSGRDLVAQALHAAGPRAKGPFVPVACGAIPQTLAESEFFGHVRGAFTGAIAHREGLLMGASGGTLFLDEISELPLDSQAKLLRALQERRSRPLGQTEEVFFDARIIATTSRDLMREVRAGRFREDLYFRLNVVSVRIPSLAERGYDVLLLAQHFIRLASRPREICHGLTPAAARALLGHPWPGNVRELENCMVAALAAARTDYVTWLDLPSGPKLEHGPAPEATALAPLEAVERSHILETLRAVNGNRTVASRILKLDRKTLQRKLKLYALESAGELPGAPREPLDSGPE